MGGNVRTWADDDPKAKLMARKRSAIINAALDAFLEEGYAGSSVNRIATAAGVSIATLYRHFASKDELFVAVIQDACSTEGDGDRPWLSMPPLEGLTEAGCELLQDALSEQKLALFRVVTRDAPRFPELGRRYQQEIIDPQIELFTKALAGWPEELRGKVRDPARAVHVFAALCKADILDRALLGLPVAGRTAIRRRAREAATDLLALVEADRL
jgi:AcrR family transcriptional regulator